MIDAMLIEKKLRKIEEFLRELETVRVDSLEDFSGNIVVKRFVERNIELAVEQMIDVCRHLVCGMDWGEPENYSDCFKILAKNGVVEQEHLGLFQSMVRYRNIIIHVYDNVDDSITYGIYKKKLGDFLLFVDYARRYAQKNTQTG